MFKLILNLFLVLLLLIKSNCYNLHFISHSHIDEGFVFFFFFFCVSNKKNNFDLKKRWIFEMDFYFLNSSGMTGNRGCVKCIYDTVTLALSGHPDRKFSVCEMGYFK